MIKIIATIIVFLGVCVDPIFDPAREYAGGQGLATRLSSPEVANGQTLLVEFTRSDMSLSVRHFSAWRGEEALRAYSHPSDPPGSYFAMLGIPYFAAPQPDTIQVSWTENEMAYTRNILFSVVDGAYKSTAVWGVPQSRVTPSPTDLRRIERERKIIADAYVTVMDYLIMPGAFDLPVENKTITDEYGTKRVFNGQLSSYHSGVDLRAYEGVPIYAAQAGLVRLAQDLFYNGNHVILEHGMGVHSTYSHMSKLYVEPGQTVEKGQLVGLSGATGRVNGPHLHWTVKVHNVGVDPLQFAEVLERLFKRDRSDKTIVQETADGS